MWCLVRGLGICSQVEHVFDPLEYSKYAKDDKSWQLSFIFVKGPVRKIKVFVSKSYLCRNMVARAERLVYSPNTAAPQGGKCNGHSRLA